MNYANIRDRGVLKRVQKSYMEESVDPFATQKVGVEQEQSLSSAIADGINISHDDTFPPVIFSRKVPEPEEDHYYSPKGSLSIDGYIDKIPPKPRQQQRGPMSQKTIQYPVVQHNNYLANPSTSYYQPGRNVQQRGPVTSYQQPNTPPTSYRGPLDRSSLSHSYNARLYSAQPRLPHLGYTQQPQQQQNPRYTAGPTNQLTIPNHYLTNPRGPVQYSNSRGPVQYSNSRGAVQYSDSRGPVQYSSSRVPVQLTNPRESVQYSDPRGPVQYSSQRGPVQYSNSRGAVQYSDSRGPVQYSSQRGSAQYSNSIESVQYPQSPDPFATQSTSYSRSSKKVDAANFLQKKWNNDSLTVFDDDCNETKNTKIAMKQKPKQVRMDEFLFKARRVDKGSREFGLLTTHEPKRGSRKKRLSIDKLELKESSETEESETNDEGEEYEEEEQQPFLDNTIQLDDTVAPDPESCSSIEYQHEVEDNFDELDATIALDSPNVTALKVIDERKSIQIDPAVALSSPPPNKPRAKTQTTPAYRRFINNFNGSSSKKSPQERRELEGTIPLNTPSPIGKSGSKKRKITDYTNNSTAKRVDIEKPKGQKSLSLFLKSSKNQPTFDDEKHLKENANMRQERNALKKEENDRKMFENQVLDREKLVKQLVDDQFIDQCQNGFDKRMENEKSELRDGDVIRNKMARKNLMHGKSCKCCKGYYDKLNMPEEEKEAYIDKVSRHRYVHNALPDTPEHYWDLTLGPSDEQLLAASSSSQKSWNVQENPTKLANWD